MSIVVVTRFKIGRAQALTVAKEAAPMHKAHGAIAVRVGYIHSGESTGQSVLALFYSG
jgi:hypothetical protein